LSYTFSSFCSHYFGHGDLKNYLPGLAYNLISASQAARIIDMSH
jgi:hypothetical protein